MRRHVAVTDPNDTQAAPALDDRAEQSTGIAPGEAEADEAASQDDTDDTDDTDDIVHHSPVWQRVVMAATLSGVALILVGGSVLTLINTLKHPSRSPANPPAKSASGPIDGTYRVDLYRGEGTIRTSDGEFPAPAPANSTIETQWWAFQSACPTPSCIAAATRLDDTTHTRIAAGPAAGQAQSAEKQSLRLVNGQWISDPPSRVPQDCAAGIPGHDTRLLTVELRQTGDGTLKGQVSDAVESNECGSAGVVVTTPIVATRIGDLPSGLPPLKTK
jgi:hypothetical protein